MKNLDVDDAHALLSELTGEVVIHFRWASIGGVDADLCHPFPVTATAKTDLFGKADAVLFHNGTWNQYDKALALLRSEHGKRIPRGAMSDTRAAALCVHQLGVGILPRLPGKWVWMGAKKTRLFGAWSDFEGMKASNLFFQQRRVSSGSYRQPSFWSCEDEPENGDPNGATPRPTATSTQEL
jgi:hypothetical protein